MTSLLAGLLAWAAVAGTLLAVWVGLGWVTDWWARRRTAVRQPAGTCQCGQYPMTDDGLIALVDSHARHTREVCVRHTRQ